MPKVILSETGRKEGVLVRYKDYMKLIKLLEKVNYEDAILASDKKFLNSLREGIEKVKLGKGLTIDEAFRS